METTTAIAREYGFWATYVLDPNTADAFADVFVGLPGLGGGSLGGGWPDGRCEHFFARPVGQSCTDADRAAVLTHLRALPGVRDAEVEPLVEVNDHPTSREPRDRRRCARWSPPGFAMPLR